MFKGSMPALVTPFKNGALDVDTLKQLVEWHIGEGSHGLVPVGTTGESPTLTHAEHDKVVQIVVEAAAGRVPVIAGAGSNNTLESIRLAQAAEKAGANGILVVTPYYNKPTQSGLIAHSAPCTTAAIFRSLFTISRVVRLLICHPRQWVSWQNSRALLVSKTPQAI